MVNLDTSQATDVCSPGDHCVYPTLATMRELVVNTDFRDYQVQVSLGQGTVLIKLVP